MFTARLYSTIKTPQKLINHLLYNNFKPIKKQNGKFMITERVYRNSEIQNEKFVIKTYKSYFNDPVYQIEVKKKLKMSEKSCLSYESESIMSFCGDPEEAIEDFMGEKGLLKTKEIVKNVEIFEKDGVFVEIFNFKVNLSSDVDKNENVDENHNKLKGDAISEESNIFSENYNELSEEIYEQNKNDNNNNFSKENVVCLYHMGENIINAESRLLEYDEKYFKNIKMNMRIIKNFF